MRSFKKTIRLLFAFPLAALVGCGVTTVPGFDFADPGQRTSITLGQYVPTDVDNPPAGVITPISPELVANQMASMPNSIPPNVKGLMGKAPPYLIGPGDVIGIIVYDHPELLPNAGAVVSQQPDPTGVNVGPGFIISATGEISFPYIGRVRLAGLSEIDASELIGQRIAKYIKDPQVTVRIQSFRSRRAYVEGEVRTPGMQIFTDVPMTLAEAISRAGGITATGDRSFITLSRAGQVTRLDLQTLQDLGADATDIPLVNGDVVTIRSREESKVYVLGEIVRPSGLLMRNGRLTLSEALGEAGGPNLATSNPGQIYVIRNNSYASPSVFHLDAKSPVALALADKFALRPKDVVYVDPVPLVQWNRVISLILPSAQVVDLGSQAATR